MATEGSNITEELESIIESESVANLLALARITENAERYEDMTKIMGSLVRKKTDQGENLELEERNMLSVAYKNVVGQRRASWRTLKQEDDAESKTEDNANKEQMKELQLKELTAQYKRVVEDELEKKCLEVLEILEKVLIKQNKEANSSDVTEVETQVFYLKMSGDYYRYLAEFSGQEDHKTKAETQYAKALALAEENLPSTHPTRLGLALNASVCFYEILKKPQAACDLAKKAFDEAIQKLDSLSDSTYKDSTLIMQLLRDNLTIWTSETDNQGNGTVEANED